jgi:glycosyltransferase involved in cell wall biosynthesis
MHILQVCFRVPYPPHDGGAIAMYETARGLSEAGHTVTVLAVNTPKHHQPANALAHLGPSVRLIPVDVDTRLSPLKALNNLLFSKRPYNVERFINQQLAETLKHLLLTETFDVVHVEGTFVAWYVAEFVAQEVAAGRMPPREQLPLFVLRSQNVEYTIWEMLALRAGNPVKKWYLQSIAQRLRAFEHRILPHFDAIIAITEEDAVRLGRMYANSSASGVPVQRGQAATPSAAPVMAVMPASFDLRRLRPATTAPQPRTVFMLGSLNWLPNLEGVDWFLREVWPLAHAELPELELHIAGSHPPESLTKRPRGQDNVVVHGFVESSTDFMAQYELMLVPLLSGGGMRVKVVEGLAVGKAILSTTIGAEGIAAHDGENILLHDSPTAWLQALRDYYYGRLPLAEISEAAARTAHELYDTQQVTAKLVQLYEQLRQEQLL